MGDSLDRNVACPQEGADKIRARLIELNPGWSEPSRSSTQFSTQFSGHYPDLSSAAVADEDATVEVVGKRNSGQPSDRRRDVDRCHPLVRPAVRHAGTHEDDRDAAVVGIGGTVGRGVAAGHVALSKPYVDAPIPEPGWPVATVAASVERQQRVRWAGREELLSGHRISDEIELLQNGGSSSVPLGLGGGTHGIDRLHDLHHLCRRNSSAFFAQLLPVLRSGEHSVIGGERHEVIAGADSAVQEGEEIAKDAIEAQERSGARLYPANLYRRIRDLLGRELIAESEAPKDTDPRRTYVAITPLGRMVAEAEARRLQALVRDAIGYNLVASE